MTVMVMAIVLLLLLSFHCAFAFSAENKKTSIAIIGDHNEALAAAMALSARDVLTTNGSQDRRHSPVPPAQPIAIFFNKRTKSPQDFDRRQQRLSSETISSLQNAVLFLGPAMDDDEQILASALQLMSRISTEDPMVHASIDFGCKEGAQTMQSLSLTRSRFSFLGLNLKTEGISRNMQQGDEGDGRCILSRESAGEWGNKLSTLLDGSTSPAAITSDIRTHLALLQANSIPRSRGVLGKEKDHWAIKDTIQNGMHVDNGDGMLFEYRFDYSDPFGGCDPLLCQSTVSIVASPSSTTYSYISDVHREANDDAYAAAYSAMVGSGVSCLPAVCIATSVKAVWGDLGNVGIDGVFSPPSYTWSTIDKIVLYSVEAGQSIRQEDGLSRKMYKEFGYR